MSLFKNMPYIQQTQGKPQEKSKRNEFPVESSCKCKAPKYIHEDGK